MGAKHQMMAIRSRKDKEEKEHMGKENKGYRTKKNEKEEHQRVSGDGDSKVKKCKHCGK